MNVPSQSAQIVVAAINLASHLPVSVIRRQEESGGNLWISFQWRPKCILCKCSIIIFPANWSSRAFGHFVAPVFDEYSCFFTLSVQSFRCLVCEFSCSDRLILCLVSCLIDSRLSRRQFGCNYSLRSCLRWNLWLWCDRKIFPVGCAADFSTCNCFNWKHVVVARSGSLLS